jgi:hypothetical protein
MDDGSRITEARAVDQFFDVPYQPGQLVHVRAKMANAPATVQHMMDMVGQLLDTGGVGVQMAKIRRRVVSGDFPT